MIGKLYTGNAVGTVLIFLLIILLAQSLRADLAIGDGRATTREAMADTEESPLVEKLLVEMQENSPKFFKSSENNLMAIRACLLDDSQCGNIELYNPIVDKTFSMHGDQKNVLDFLRSIYQQYRMYIGHRNSKDFRSMWTVGLNFIGMPQSSPVHFDRFSDQGQKEIALIDKAHSSFIQSVKTLTKDMPYRQRKNSEQGLWAMRNSAHDQMISTLSNTYPFLMKLSSPQVMASDFASAIEKTIEDYDDAIEYTNSLQGKERFELLGFIPVMEMTLASWSEANANQVLNTIYSYKSKQSFFERIMDILSNGYTWSIAGCHLVTSVVLFVAKPICFIWGFAVALPGMWDAGRKNV